MKRGLETSFFINKFIKELTEDMSRITSNEVQGLMEAYVEIYAPQELTEEQVWEEVENWVYSLVEEGYDLSDYTWEDMYEEYLNEMGQRATTGQMTAPKAAPTTTTPKPYVPAGGGMGGRRGGRTSPVKPRTTVPTVPKLSPIPRRGLGNIPKPEGTGIGGPSDLARNYGRDTTSYQAGGGARSGQSIKATMQQGRANLSRMDQSKPAPAGARPTSGPSSVNPKTGLSAYPATSTRPAAATSTRPAARPAAATSAPSKQKPSIPSAPPPPTSGPSAPPPPTAKRPSAKEDIEQMIKASQQRQAAMLKQSFDLYDIIKGHLLDEGYADTEEAAEAIMVSMSEDWRESILEQMAPPPVSAPPHPVDLPPPVSAPPTPPKTTKKNNEGKGKPMHPKGEYPSAESIPGWKK